MNAKLLWGKEPTSKEGGTGRLGTRLTLGREMRCSGGSGASRSNASNHLWRKDSQLNPGKSRASLRTNDQVESIEHRFSCSQVGVVCDRA